MNTRPYILAAAMIFTHCAMTRGQSSVDILTDYEARYEYSNPKWLTLATKGKTQIVPTTWIKNTFKKRMLNSAIFGDINISR